MNAIVLLRKVGSFVAANLSVESVKCALES